MAPGKMREEGSARGAGLASMVSSSPTRMKPHEVMASLARSCDELTGAVDEGSRVDHPIETDDQGSAGHDDPEGYSPRRVFELEADGPHGGKGLFREADADIPPPVLSLLGAEEGGAIQTESCGAHDAADCADTACDSTPSLEDAIAVEVGLSAQEYLDECFYVTEVSVLDKDKFDAVPEIVKGDFTILGHLGKGSFSDVFEVTYKGTRFPPSEICEDDKARRKSDDPLACGPSPPQRRSSNARRQRNGGLSSSVCGPMIGLSSSVAGTLVGRPVPSSKPTYALKCLRPQIRSDAEQFTIGAEDLVHETAILASLGAHPHIVALHGRASGHLADAFVLNDGYFILVEKLGDTLPDRIKAWREDPSLRNRGPTPEKLGVVRDVADAVSYLHSKRIIFRDLKPANVGFNPDGVVKLFDFGFAAGLPAPTRENPDGLLYERCGTPRFMAPEVGLDRGYGLGADVYSLGILLWEVCAMETPFSDIVRPEDFDARVFVRGERPPVDREWPALVRRLLERCWSASPGRRSSMAKARSALAVACGGRRGGRLGASATRDRLKNSLGRSVRVRRGTMRL